MVGLASSFGPSSGECGSFDLSAPTQSRVALLARPPDYERESRTLRTLTTAVAESPGTALYTLPAAMIDAFRAGSSGVSLVRTEGDASRWQWVAVAGEWSNYVGLAAARDASALTPPAEDCLSVPIQGQGAVVGALWIVVHDRRRRFDAEDLRLLQNCAGCASAAYHAADSVAPSGQRVDPLLPDADRKKDIFIATLAHELRQPAAAITTAIRVLRDLPDERGRQRTLDVLDRQAKHLRRLVDDVLDVTRIVEGKLELRKERVDVRDVIQEACAATARLFRARQQVLSTWLPTRTVWLYADRTRLQQVMTNLLTNAAKYTPHAGEVDVVVTADAESVTIRIRDNGMGIGADALPHVFDLFMQQTITSAGLGIGLKVVRELVERHGGSVTVHSEGVGKGSEFTVTLPVASPRTEGSSSLGGPYSDDSIHP
jgi:signal transduction histidine kinase